LSHIGGGIIGFTIGSILGASVPRLIPPPGHAEVISGIHIREVWLDRWKYLEPVLAFVGREYVPEVKEERPHSCWLYVWREPGLDVGAIVNVWGPTLGWYSVEVARMDGMADIYIILFGKEYHMEPVLEAERISPGYFFTHVKL